MNMVTKQALAARFAKVWELERPRWHHAFDGIQQHGHTRDGLKFTAAIWDVANASSWHLYVECPHEGAYSFGFSLRCAGGVMKIEDGGVPKLFTEWENERGADGLTRRNWFRRACWLSGLGVEVSAHEKLEWLKHGRVLGLRPAYLQSL